MNKIDSNDLLDEVNMALDGFKEDKKALGYLIGETGYGEGRFIMQEAYQQMDCALRVLNRTKKYLRQERKNEHKI